LLRHLWLLWLLRGLWLLWLLATNLLQHGLGAILLDVLSPLLRGHTLEPIPDILALAYTLLHEGDGVSLPGYLA
tara:strand:+ start:90 stop:311 length:222 start_codon:yes stop_codon:yes gene_type:complete